MIYPLLPFFLTNILHAGPAFLGLVEGIAETTSSLLKLASGWFSDRLGKRKSLVVLGYGIASFARPLVAIATAPVAGAGGPLRRPRGQGHPHCAA